MSHEKEDNRNTIIYAVIAEEPKLKDVRARATVNIRYKGKGDKPLNIHYTNIRFRRWIFTNFASG